VANIEKKSVEVLRELWPASPIILFDRFLESLGITPATGWRWRKRGWVNTLNISGRVYIARAEISRFEERVAAGEFAKTHKTPKRKAANK
jgi:hypothetical protein